MAKRLIDIVVSALLLVLLSPVVAIIALAIRRELGPPVLFRQMRPGFNGEPFELIKFRTMRAVYPGEDALASDAARLSPLGKALRHTSLDELPGLWNVLRGDMSLVGPRPLLCEYLPLYNEHQARRHEVRPGVTGWAQVNGRNALDWETKFDLDVWYVDNRSLWLDMRILALTVKKVIGRSDIAAPGQVTMTAFAGSSKHTEEPPPP